MFANRRVFAVTTISLLFIPVIVLIRLIGPIVLIRVGFVHSAIGHMVLGSELYLARKAHNLEPRRTIDLFLVDTRHANTFVVGMLRHRLTIVWRPLIRALIRANEMVPGKSRHLIDTDAFMDPDDLFAITPPQLDFTDTGSSQADDGLKALGVEPMQPFVCLHVRDTAFKVTTNPQYNSLNGDYRNADIEDFIDAALSLVSRGYVVIRMGAVVSTDLPPGLEGVIDYARSGMRSDFMDAVLAARCAFWLGTQSGVNSLAIVNRRPVVYVDCIPMGLATSWAPDDIYIPKKLRDSEGRLLTIWEILRGEIGWPQMHNGGWYHTLSMYQERDFTIIDNSRYEIRAVAEEMDDHLSGRIRPQDEREDRIQVEISSLLEASRWHGKARARIGSAFIKSNPDLVTPF
jgi:putative glycosyltransferase (TIGR04372 family)